MEKYLDLRTMRTARRLLVPAYYVHSVGGINPEVIFDAFPDTDVFSWDLDCCLLEHHGEQVPPEHLAVMGLIARCGKEQIVISNANSPDRVKRVQGIVGSISTELGIEVHYITSSEVGGIKKPASQIFNKASERLSVPLSRFVHTGDQLFKDTIGGNLVGAVTVLVAPYGDQDDGNVARYQRPLEEWVRPRIGLPRDFSDFPQSLTQVA